MRVYHDGSVVYSLSGDQQYYLGQPGDPEYKIPAVPNGADLTGDRRSDMIVTSWSGGAHCCYTHYIFELEPEFRLLAKIYDGDTDLAHFEKIADGRGYYYVTYDIWSYWPASFASSVTHKVILKWDGNKFHIDLERMHQSAPTPQQWKAALNKVDLGLGNKFYARDSLGVNLWSTVLDLIYTGHSDLAWKFVGEVNPDALKGGNPSLEEFCTLLKADEYWPDLEPTLKDMPEECAKAHPKK